jgi:hypothetical protein
MSDYREAKIVAEDYAALVGKSVVDEDGNSGYIHAYVPNAYYPLKVIFGNSDSFCEYTKEGYCSSVDDAQYEAELKECCIYELPKMQQYIVLVD